MKPVETVSSWPVAAGAEQQVKPSVPATDLQTGRPLQRGKHLTHLFHANFSQFKNHMTCIYLMTRGRKTCNDTINPSASPSDKLSLSPAPESTHMRNQAFPSPSLQPLSQSNNKSKQDPKHLSFQAGQIPLLCWRTSLGQQETTPAIRRKGHEEPQLVSQIPHVPKKLQCQTWPGLQAPRRLHPHLPGSLWNFTVLLATCRVVRCVQAHYPDPYMQSCICVDQCTAPGCQINPSTSIPLIKLFLWRIKRKGLE